MGEWTEGYTHNTLGGKWRARQLDSGDWEAVEIGPPGEADSEAQLLPADYFRAEFHLCTCEEVQR